MAHRRSKLGLRRLFSRTGQPLPRPSCPPSAKCARFGGPDVGASSDWVIRFGEQVPARRSVLAAHRPDRPLLRRGSAQRSAHDHPPGFWPAIQTFPPKCSALKRGARAHGRVYRMTEGNSCYRGGKPGMSDAFAAALWGGRLHVAAGQPGMCRRQSARGQQCLSHRRASADHTPGMDVAKTPQNECKGGFYTPISS
jgi:hypothetical protein